MTLWVLHVPLTEEEEASIITRETLPLPLDAVPDLTRVRNLQDAKSLMRLLHAGEAPETITSAAENVMRMLGLQPEDIVMVPLPLSETFVLARVTKNYVYRMCDNGQDEHGIAVVCFPPIAMSKLRKHKELFVVGKEKLKEVTNAEVRKDILSHLPYGKNRFRKLKWIIGAVFVLKMTLFGLHKLYS